jgi:hypothetical protein
MVEKLRYKDTGWREVVLAASLEHTVEANAVAAESPVHVGGFDKALILLDITASATDAGDTLDVYVDVSFDNSTWLNAVHFTQQAGNGSAAKEIAFLDASADPTDPDAVKVVTSDAGAAVVRPEMTGMWIRCRSTVVRLTGTDEAHTFSVVALLK